MDQEKRTKLFFDAYGEREWDRLERTAYDKLNFLLHMDFIDDVIFEGAKVLDAGCGAGRFTIEFTNSDAMVDILDISEEQLKLAEDKVEKYGSSARLKAIYHGSISDMSDVASDTYDTVVCYGAPLNYLYQDYMKGIKELFRVVKPGGKVFVSVNSRFGVIRALMGREHFDITGFLGRPDYWYLHEVMDTGDLKEHPEVPHPPRHLFEAMELKTAFEETGFQVLKMGTSPCLGTGLRTSTEEIAEDEVALETLYALERAVYQKETTLDVGEFILLCGQKPE